MVYVSVLIRWEGIPLLNTGYKNNINIKHAN